MSQTDQYTNKRQRTATTTTSTATTAVTKFDDVPKCVWLHIGKFLRHREVPHYPKFLWLHIGKFRRLREVPRVRYNAMKATNRLALCSRHMKSMFEEVLAPHRPQQRMLDAFMLVNRSDFLTEWRTGQIFCGLAIHAFRGLANWVWHGLGDRDHKDTDFNDIPFYRRGTRWLYIGQFLTVRQLSRLARASRHMKILLHEELRKLRSQVRAKKL